MSTATSTTFVTSDIHFGHIRNLDLSQRPFSSIEAHDETLIENWNSVVDPTSDVFVVGDYALGDRQRALGYLERLNGRKHLIEGNHDRCWRGRPDGWKHQRAYLDAGFETVAPFARLKLPPTRYDRPGRKVLLSHFPYDGDHTDEDRYTQYRLRDEGVPLIHGHVHRAYTVRRSARGTIGVNVGVDQWNYTPVALSTIATLIDEVESGLAQED